MLEIFSKVKTASRSLALIPDARRDEILLAVADAILANEASLLEATCHVWISLTLFMTAFS